MHALIVDDEEVTCRAIASHLRHIGFYSFDYAHPQDAEKAAADEHRPQLIVADMTPEPRSIDAVKSIASQRWIPLVFVTTLAEEMRARLPDAFVVAKPVDPEELGSAVRLALALRGL